MNDTALSDAALLSQLKSLELQLRILRKQIEKRNGEQPARSFAELRGCWAEHGTFSEEEIDAVLYRFDPERFDNDQTNDDANDASVKP